MEGNNYIKDEVDNLAESYRYAAVFRPITYLDLNHRSKDFSTPTAERFQCNLANFYGKRFTFSTRIDQLDGKLKDFTF